METGVLVSLFHALLEITAQPIDAQQVPNAIKVTSIDFRYLSSSGYLYCWATSIQVYNLDSPTCRRAPIIKIKFTLNFRNLHSNNSTCIAYYFEDEVGS